MHGDKGVTKANTMLFGRVQVGCFCATQWAETRTFNFLPVAQSLEEGGLRILRVLRTRRGTEAIEASQRPRSEIRQ